MRQNFKSSWLETLNDLDLEISDSFVAGQKDQTPARVTAGVHSLLPRMVRYFIFFQIILAH